MITNPDGSIDLYLQAESPGKDKEANWLPAPKGKFQLVMRLYAPKKASPSVLDGSWMPPPVKKRSLGLAEYLRSRAASSMAVRLALGVFCR